MPASRGNKLEPRGESNVLIVFFVHCFKACPLPVLSVLFFSMAVSMPAKKTVLWVRWVGSQWNEGDTLGFKLREKQQTTWLLFSRAERNQNQSQKRTLYATCQKQDGCF